MLEIAPDISIKAPAALLCSSCWCSLEAASGSGSEKQRLHCEVTALLLVEVRSVCNQLVGNVLQASASCTGTPVYRVNASSFPQAMSQQHRGLHIWCPAPGSRLTGAAHTESYAPHTAVLRVWDLLVGEGICLASEGSCPIWGWALRAEQRLEMSILSSM